MRWELHCQERHRVLEDSATQVTNRQVSSHLWTSERLCLAGMVWFKLLNWSTTFKNREIPSSKLGSSLLFKVRSVSLWACFSWHHGYSQVTESPLRRSGPLWFALLSTIPCYFPPGLSHSLKPCPTFYAFGLLACVKDRAQVLYLTPVPIYLPPK